jgi:hypothetical protein
LIEESNGEWVLRYEGDAEGDEAVATLGMLESLGTILKEILSTQLPNTIIFKPYFQYLNKKRQKKRDEI